MIAFKVSESSSTLDAGLESALVAAAVAIVYRVAAAIAYRDRPLVRVMAEEVPAAELRYVVPFEARSRYVGADYVEQLAKIRGGTFRLSADLTQTGGAVSGSGDLKIRNFTLWGAPTIARITTDHGQALERLSNMLDSVSVPATPTLVEIESGPRG